jgi:large subunit ribosomal protein L23
MHLYEVLRRPLITEKNTLLKEIGKYAFDVAIKANKNEIKKAVEKAFNVEVMSVNIISVHGKTKRRGRGLAVTPSRKKAVVTVKRGQKIEFFEGI